MIFQINNHKFDTLEKRQQFARTLSHIIEGSPFEPWAPPHQSHFWRLDSANNWTVSFYEYNLDRFSVSYRYQSNECGAEQALGEWLKYRLHCTPIE